MLRHVLIVDDAKSVQRILEASLLRAGFAVTIADDAPSGLAVMRSTLHPLVVLLDDEVPPAGSTDMLAAALTDPWIGDRHAFIIMYARASGQPEPGPRAEKLAQALPRPPILTCKPFRAQEIVQVIIQAAHDLDSRP